MDSYHYKVEVEDDGLERTVACVNLRKHKLYRGLVQRIQRGFYTCLFEVVDYTLPYVKIGSLCRYRGQRVNSKVFDIPSLTELQLTELRSMIPLELLHMAFKYAIPELYLYNKRVTSSKYKKLVANYEELEENYIRRFIEKEG